MNNGVVHTEPDTRIDPNPEPIVTTKIEPFTGHTINDDAIYRFGVMSDEGGADKAHFNSAWIKGQFFSVAGHDMRKPAPSKIATIKDFVDFNPAEFPMTPGKVYSFFQQVGPEEFQLVGQYTVGNRRHATLSDRRARKGGGLNGLTPTDQIDQNSYQMPTTGNAYQANLWKQQAQQAADLLKISMEGQQVQAMEMMKMIQANEVKREEQMQQMMQMMEQKVRAEEGEKQQRMSSQLKDEIRAETETRVRKEEEAKALSDKSVGMSDVLDFAGSILSPLMPHLGPVVAAKIAEWSGTAVPPAGAPTTPPTGPAPGATDGRPSPTPGFEQMQINSGK